MKKFLISFYLLLTAALLLLPVPGEALEAKTRPSSARPAFPAAPAAFSAQQEEAAGQKQQEKPDSKSTHGELTRLYAPPVPGMSVSSAGTGETAAVTLGSSTANIPPNQTSPEGSYLPWLEKELLEALNARRTEEGCPPLEGQAALQRCARLRAREMVQSGCFSHTRPDGSPWNTALPDPETLACPLRGEIFGVALGATPQRAAARWLEEWDKSPSERENICLPEFEAAGIGVYSRLEEGKLRTCAVLLFSGNSAMKRDLSISFEG